MTTRFALAFYCVIASTLSLYSQSASDCIGAVPVCTNPYILNFIPKEQNHVSGEIHSSNTCLATGDTKGRWYRFASTGAGTLNFSISPQDTTYDLDWALFSMYNRSCSDIWSDASLLLSCNFYGVQGNNGSTGISNTPGGPYSQPVDVDSVTLFYLYISHHWLGIDDTLGYTINFSGTTFGFQDCNIIGINSSDQFAGFQVFPNPFSNQINIEGLTHQATITLYNTSGQTAFTQLFYNSPVMMPHEINPGVYILEVITPNAVYRRKIIHSKH